MVNTSNRDSNYPVITTKLNSQKMTVDRTLFRTLTCVLNACMYVCVCVYMCVRVCICMCVCVCMFAMLTILPLNPDDVIVVEVSKVHMV